MRKLLKKLFKPLTLDQINKVDDMVMPILLMLALFLACSFAIVAIIDAISN